MITRVRGIIFEDDAIVCMYRNKPGKGEYYVFPGGGVEPGESLEEALGREVFEETGYKVKNIKPLYKSKNEAGEEELFYGCQIEEQYSENVIQ